MDKMCEGCIDNRPSNGLLKMMCITTCKEIEERKWPASYRRYKSE